MVDGRITLTYSGPQDIYLTVDPQTSYFRCVYKRHSSFAVSTRKEVITNEGFDRLCKCRLTKNGGDLIKNIFLSVNFDSIAASTDPDLKFGWANSLGHALIDYYLIEFNGRQIDKQYGEWLEIWNELSQTLDKRSTYNEMIGKVDPFDFSVETFPLTEKMDLIIPLNFWFCRFASLALPVVSMYRTEIDITFKFKEFNSLWVTNKPNKYPLEKPGFSANLLVDYIYLSDDERKMFHAEEQVYLIEQLDVRNYSATYKTKSINADINFNHPVKELIWVLQRNDVVQNPINFSTTTTTQGYPFGNDWFNFTPELDRRVSSRVDSFNYGTIQLDGTEIFEKMTSKYFRLCHPYMYHTRGANNNIYAYSFSFKPEELPPTGQVNFSTITHARLNLTLPRQIPEYPYDDISAPTELGLRIYAVNYNILNVRKGNADVCFR